MKSQSRIFKRAALIAISGVGLALIGAGVFLVMQWPKASLGASSNALAQIKLSGIAQKVSAVTATADNKAIPVVIKGGAIIPSAMLPVSTPVTLSVSLERPSWISWLTGKSEAIKIRVVTPTAKLLNPVAFGSPTKPLLGNFSAPVRTVSLTSATGTKILHLTNTTTKVSLKGVVGSSPAGTLEVAASPESWETLPAASLLTYFQGSGTTPIAVISPTPSNLSPSSNITITLSQTIASAFGSKLPSIDPVINGANPLKGVWTETTPYTLLYTPSAPEFWPSEQFTLTLPVAVDVSVQNAKLADASATIPLQGASPSITRLQELLAQLNYLPLSWTPAAGDAPSGTSAALAQSALQAPNGTFSWRWQMPSNFTSLWQQGSDNVITRGAVMSSEQFNHLDSSKGPPNSR